MKIKKHLFLTAAMLLCSFAVGAQDIVEINNIWYLLLSDLQQAEVTSNPDGNTKYSGSIDIPSTIVYEDVEYSVTSVGFNAFSGCSSLTSIVLPECVMCIGDEAFSGCIGLTSIALPDNVVYIGGAAFSGCSNLSSVVIPENVTDIMYCTFQYCSNLTSVTIPENVTSIGYNAFKECSSLTSITLPENVASIGESAFYGCIYNHRTTKTNQKYPSVNL